MQLICNRTQNDAIWELIALFLTNQIAGNTIDFKMDVINCVKHNMGDKIQIKPNISSPYNNLH